MVFVSVFGLFRVFADEIPFAITNVEITDKSETTSGNITGFDNNRVNNNVTFHKVGDSVTYKMSIKNVSNTPRVIDNISSSYKGELFTYEFNSYAKDTIEAGDSFDFVLKTTYSNPVSDVNRRNQNLEIEIVFEFSDGSEATIIIVNPSTWDNISMFGVILAASVIGLMLIVIFQFKRMKNGKKLIILGALLAFACLPLPFANAADGVYDAVLASNYTLNDELVVHFVSEDGGEEITREIIGYGEHAAAVVVPDEKEGYYFDAWLSEDGEPFDFATPITEDITLRAKYAPYVTTLQFDGNGATSGAMTAQQINYDEAATIKKNGFERNGYDFINWKDDNGNEYADQQEVKNLCNTNCAITLHANWKARTDTPYYVVYELMNIDGDEYVPLPAIKHTGTTDEYAMVQPEDFAHFVAPAIQPTKINGDGSTTIHYKYAREQFTLKLVNAQYIETTTPAGKYNYGKTINLKAKGRAGWKFEKWSNDSTDEEISFVMESDVEIGPTYKETGLKTVYSHQGACTFNGLLSSDSGKDNGLLDADNITGDECTEYADQKYIDTGVHLFSKENAHKDFSVEFTIDEFIPSKNGRRATFVSATLEKSSVQFPGFVFRRDDGSTTNYLLGLNVVKDRVKTLNAKIKIPAANVRKVKIFRKNDNYCYAINGGTPVYVGDNTPFNEYYDSTALLFGVSIDEGTSSKVQQRYLNGTLSGMVVKLGEDIGDTLQCNSN